MAFSSSEGKLLFKDWLIHIAAPFKFRKFFDVGAGAGQYGQIIREVFDRNVIIHAVEIFEPYINRHNLRSIYDVVQAANIIPLLDSMEEYDLIIMGDVLEHMEKEVAIDAVFSAREKCKFVWGALPMKVDGCVWSHGYNQGPDDYAENPHNLHKHDWAFKEIWAYIDPLWVIPFVTTGTFLVEGKIECTRQL